MRTCQNLTFKCEKYSFNLSVIQSALKAVYSKKYAKCFSYKLLEKYKNKFENDD